MRVRVRVCVGSHGLSVSVMGCRARYQPQNSFLVATKTPKGDVLLFDFAKLSSGSGSGSGSGSDGKPVLRLTGHTDEGYGLAWSPLEAGKLLSGSDDMKVCLWDTNAAPGKDSVLPPLFSLTSHTAVVEDVAWHAHHKDVFASVSDDKRLLLWDQRDLGSGKPRGDFSAHDAEVNCVAFNPGQVRPCTTLRRCHSCAARACSVMGSWWGCAGVPVGHGLLGQDGGAVGLAQHEHQGALLRVACRGGVPGAVGPLQRRGTLHVWGLPQRPVCVCVYVCVLVWCGVRTRVTVCVDVCPIVVCMQVLASSGADRRVNIWDMSRIGQEQSAEDAEDGPPELLVSVPACALRAFGSGRDCLCGPRACVRAQFVHGGHTSRISDFSWSSNEDWMVASVAEDNILQIWQLVRRRSRSVVRVASCVCVRLSPLSGGVHLRR